MSARWTRLVGLALAVALSGAPAAVAACAAACLPMPTPAHAHDGAPSDPVVPDSALMPAGHEHHHPGAAAAAAPITDGTRVGTSAGLHACCPEPLALTADVVTALRADARVVPGALSMPIMWRHTPSPGLVSRPARPPAAWSGGARTPFVLRI